MGRTVPAFRPALESELKTWDAYKRGLRSNDREIFNKLMGYTRIHADAGSLAARPELTQVMFISMFLEQQKEIELLNKKIKKLEMLLKEG
ncbi:MAG: hypothetical protein ACTSWY_01180 [Promethearchaeota archaeon]